MLIITTTVLCQIFQSFGIEITKNKHVWEWEDSQGLTSLLGSYYYVQMIFVGLKSFNCYHVLASFNSWIESLFGYYGYNWRYIIAVVTSLRWNPFWRGQRVYINEEILTSVSTRRARWSNTIKFVRINGSSYLLR